MASGKTIRRMVLENTPILTEPSTKVTGLMTNSTDREKKSGLMVLNMKETTNSAKKMAMVNFYGLIDHHTRVDFLTITYMATENINGPMGENLLEIGFVTKCMVRVYSLGPMAEDTKANIMMTRSKVMEFSYGQMVDSMMELG